MVQKLQPTLEEVQQLFEEWRRNKRRRDRIPAALWEAAASLSGRVQKSPHMAALELQGRRRYPIGRSITNRSMPCPRQRYTGLP